MSRAEGIATDPGTGHAFVIDADNSRIDEFTPWGEFVKAFGWDVAPGAVNEQQEITVVATAGQFRLTFGGSTTGDLERAAPATGAGSIEAALNGLASVNAGGGSLTVAKGASDGSSSRYVVAFSGGPLAGSDVPQLGGKSGTIPLSGTPSAGVLITTRADGTPGGVGLESCTAESGCKAGSKGSSTGQLDVPAGIAVAANGDIYVRENSETDMRIQKYDSAGRFILMVGGEVEKATHVNLCGTVTGEECGTGVPGTGPGQFSQGRGIAVGATGTVYVADADRIQDFEPAGLFDGAIAVAGKVVERLAIDLSSGDLYATFGSEENIRKLSPSGVSLCTVAVPRPTVLATDSAGHLYVVNTVSALPEAHEEVLEFDSDCTKTSEFGFSGAVNLLATAMGTNTAGDLLLARSDGTLNFVQIYGPPPISFEPPPAVAPTIATQFLASADFSRASVKAQINPNFWTDTSYYVEYGAGKCSEGGCTLIQPPTSVELGAGVVRELINTAAIELADLSPRTTYHYRFVAQSGGGGPVRGIGGKVGLDGAEGTFTTTALPEPQDACPANEAFRVGPSAALPDCRAYEMVSPVDKENGDILALGNVSGYENRLNQSSSDGEALTYSSYRDFANPQSAPYTSQYIARRGAGGWTSAGLSAPRSGAGVFNIFGATENEFKAFTPNLCSAWLVNDTPPLLAAGAVERFPNLFRRANCVVSGSYEALTTVRPSGALPSEFPPESGAELQGYAADGSKVVFRAPYKMSTDAKEGVEQAYEANGGEPRLLCILPSEVPYAGNCSAGAAAPLALFHNRGASVSHAVSDDGSHVYWTASNESGGPGKIYLRLDGSETVKVSEAEGAGKTTLKAQFQGASADGTTALFTVSEGAKKDSLYKYSVESGSSFIAGKVLGIAGQSEDLAYVYFVSEEQIGGNGTSGKANLYLDREGTSSFIATLSGPDVNRGGTLFSDIEIAPILHLARATPDGRDLTFVSTNRLTGFDNTDAETGEADSEVFRYDAEGEELDCISCSPVGARPQGRKVQVPAGLVLPSAATLPAGENQLYTPRALSDNGNRLFFTSFVPLVPGDRNGKADVYEWEAPGLNGCKEGAAAFSTQNGGCLYLISSGESPEDSELVDSSPSGRDVFFSTEQSLLAQDPGLIDIYDARDSGGFTPVPTPPRPCEGEACQSPAPPPAFTAPGSGSVGPGNPPIKRQGCARGKHKVSKSGRSRCVPNKKKNSGKKSGKNTHKSGRADK
ncbi:MAG: hypothetical protein H0X42_07110 [Solirubrobacterales bacterium]|nr:hypothetical protein [Solirubrobacterales bacterium]